MTPMTIIVMDSPWYGASASSSSRKRAAISRGTRAAFVPGVAVAIHPCAAMWRCNCGTWTVPVSCIRAAHLIGQVVGEELAHLAGERGDVLVLREIRHAFPSASSSAAELAQLLRGAAGEQRIRPGPPVEQLRVVLFGHPETAVVLHQPGR